MAKSILIITIPGNEEKGDRIKAKMKEHSIHDDYHVIYICDDRKSELAIELLSEQTQIAKNGKL